MYGPVNVRPGSIVFLDEARVKIKHVDECSVSWCDPDHPAVRGITTVLDFAVRFSRDPRNFAQDPPPAVPELNDELEM